MSCHTYEWVMSHIWMSHVTHMNESCLTHEWVMSHMNESCHTYEQVMPYTCRSHVTYIRMRRVTHAYQRQSWRRALSVQRHATQIKSHVTHNNEKKRHTNGWVMSHMWMNHATHVNASCHEYTRVMPHLYTSHVSHVNRSCVTCERVTSSWHTYSLETEPLASSKRAKTHHTNENYRSLL